MFSINANRYINEEGKFTKFAVNNLKMIWLLLVSSVLWTSASLGKTVDVTEGIRKCAQTSDQEKRYTCYDKLGETVLEADKEAIAGNLPDHIGGTAFAEKAGIKPTSNRGLVKRCQKAADRQWFYIFENGQVWKQVDRRKRRHKDCNFYVSITKDSLGYIMIIDDKDTKIRVKRHR